MRDGGSGKGGTVLVIPLCVLSIPKDRGAYFRQWLAWFVVVDATPKLFSALEIADFTVLLTSFAIFFLVNSKSLKATSAFFPLIKLHTRASFLGLVLTFLLIAFTKEVFFSIIFYLPLV